MCHQLERIKEQPRQLMTTCLVTLCLILTLQLLYKLLNMNRNKKTQESRVQFFLPMKNDCLEEQLDLPYKVKEKVHRAMLKTLTFYTAKTHMQLNGTSDNISSQKLKNRNYLITLIFAIILKETLEKESFQKKSLVLSVNSHRLII